jgi:hypothetical protein
MRVRVESEAKEEHMQKDKDHRRPLVRRASVPRSAQGSPGFFRSFLGHKPTSPDSQEVFFSATSVNHLVGHVLRRTSIRRSSPAQPREKPEEVGRPRSPGTTIL